MCHPVARNPKFAPDAISIVLFGPGVIEDTKANSANPASSWGLVEIIESMQYPHGKSGQVF